MKSVGHSWGTNREDRLAANLRQQKSFGSEEKLTLRLQRRL
jgi:hypothetical protein